MDRKVHIHLKRETDRSYDIEIGLPMRMFGKKIHAHYPGLKKFIITDTTVGKHYAHVFAGSFRGTTGNVEIITIPAGEKNKTRAMKERIENKLLAAKADRNSLIVALGGGVVGDIAGFVAATYMRGIPYIHIPTTLLAQVDSSIGGKVAVDHPLGKNLIGAFYQPSHVFIDPNVLSTLPEREYINGLAEVIKYAAILDKKLFTFLETHRQAILRRKRQTLLTIIERCCELKRDIIQQDETETGLRRILNFGHTIGHAIERYSRYVLPHGEAIAIGMVMESKISVRKGMLSRSAFEGLVHLIASYNLPTALLPAARLRRIVRLTSSDKKSHQGNVAYTLLNDIGKAKTGVVLTQEQVMAFLSR